MKINESKITWNEFWDSMKNFECKGIMKLTDIHGGVFGKLEWLKKSQVIDINLYPEYYPGKHFNCYMQNKGDTTDVCVRVRIYTFKNDEYINKDLDLNYIHPREKNPNPIRIEDIFKILKDMNDGKREYVLITKGWFE